MRGRREDTSHEIYSGALPSVLHQVSIEVREAGDDDLAALARIRDEGGWDGGAPETRMRGYLRGDVNPQYALAPRVMYLAHDDGAPIGYIAGHLTRRFDCDGELEWLFVLPGHRRAGAAALMLRALAGWFRTHDAARVCVNVAPDNEPAVRFYERFGAVPLNDYFRVWNDMPAALANV